MIGISKLDNTVQEYAWGSMTAIPELLGLTNFPEKPQAELWMGAHSKAPSNVVIKGRTVSLLDVIKNDPAAVLGKTAAEKFSGTLPFLFKVLAAGKPLSIQAHPTKDQAGEGFERENRRNIPLNAFNRNYKDTNHKPEIISALTTFWALNGFRPLKNLLELLDLFNLKSISGYTEDLRSNPDSEGLKTFFSSLLALPGEIVEQAQVKAELLLRKHGTYIDDIDDIDYIDDICRWIIRLGSFYPGDIGILSPIILNLICLKPGDTMFLQAGKLHAYLDGLGIELMANSDNVIRGGLTPKHMDVPELLKILNFKGQKVEFVQTKDLHSGEMLYISPVEEFRLSRIHIDTGRKYISCQNRSVEIMICTQGMSEIHDLDKNEVISLDRGVSVIVPASVKQYRITGNAVIYKATVGG